MNEENRCPEARLSLAMFLGALVVRASIRSGGAGLLDGP